MSARLGRAVFGNTFELVKVEKNQGVSDLRIKKKIFFSVRKSGTPFFDQIRLEA